MVEKIVQKEGDVTTEEKNVLFKLPKHVKQLGTGGNTPEIYIEDYAEGYLKRLAERDATECCVAVLVGEFVKSEGKRYVFIRGAIEAESVVVDNKVKFTSEVWAGVYEKIKRFFPYYEAVGWFLGGPEEFTRVTDEIRQIHIDWFGGRDRVLFRIDPVERESAFYLYDNGELKFWPGYSIYYDKNEEMQDYLVAGAPPSVDEGYKEPVLAELAKKVGRKQDTDEVPAETPVLQESVVTTERQKVKQSGKENTKHTTGVVAAIAILALGIYGLRQRELGKTVDAGTATQVPTVVSGQQTGDAEEVIQTNVEAKPTEAGLRESRLEGSIYEREFIPVTESPYVPETGETTEPTPAVVTSPPEMTVTPSPTKVPEEETQAEPLKLYVVQSGDTLAGICRSFYGTTARMEEIKGINQIWDENWIYAGQELYLP